MPLYEYQCDACNKIHEVIQKFSDPLLTKCPGEGCSGTVKKLMSSTSFALKGSGWYVTDYKKKPSKAADAPSPAPAAPPAPKSTT